MTNRKFSWCPKFCGKKVIFIGRKYFEDGYYSIYKCQKCKREFTKEELL